MKPEKWPRPVQKRRRANSMNQKNAQLLFDELGQWLNGAGNVGIAVSGGVDSTTLAIALNLHSSDQCRIYHAVSAAVPKAASNRLSIIAEKEDWKFEVVDAGEFEDPNYLRNPVNRCYFCKHNLYETIAGIGIAEQLLLSGTNLDDMEDFRPGLKAAAKFEVRHPYVELGINKNAVRSLAKFLGYEDLAELPASPCLSSRIETGIPVDAETLIIVDQVEQFLNSELSASTVRCRVRESGLVVELSEECLSLLDASQRRLLSEHIRAISSPLGSDFPVEFASYRKGSAFIQDRVV